MARKPQKSTVITRLRLTFATPGLEPVMFGILAARKEFSFCFLLRVPKAPCRRPRKSRCDGSVAAIRKAVDTDYQAIEP